MNECLERGCSGEVDRDGYCRRFGHLCQAVVLVAAGSATTTSTTDGPATVTPGKTSDPADGTTGTAAGAATIDPLAGTATAGQAAATPSAGHQPMAQPSSSAPTSKDQTTDRPSSAGTPTPLPPLSRTEGSLPRWAEWVQVPTVPIRDPSTAVLVNPSVPESKRFCSRCRLPVGRGSEGRTGRVEGFCPRDRTPFSFTPKLDAGDRINQFEVLGCLAHGGVGWVYLARDLNLDGTWRVLKGLRDAGDADAWEAVVAERRFLAQVDHPNIVKIYDFVQRTDPLTGAVAGYIVMEYVGGRSLHDMLVDLRCADGAPAALPLPQVLAYGADILSAFDYLHGRGLLYCDLKPDNVIHGEDRLKLIDLGAVRHQDDWSGPFWGTTGFQAPEISISGPSIRSDLYAVGRTLAVLSLDVPNLTIGYPDRLPDPSEAPLLAAEESYYRLLQRATHPDPERRFASAARMREQLIGVLREVLSASDGRPRPAQSTLFGVQPRSFGTGAVGDPPVRPEPSSVVEALPVPLVDPADPAASYLGTLGYPDPDETIAALQANWPSTIEVTLRLVRAHIDSGNLDAARGELTRLGLEHPEDWRVAWYQGVVSLAADQPADALSAFDLVYVMLPGETDARLAYSVSAELAGDVDTAATHYDRVWLTNRDYISAAFGSARLRLTAGDWAGAVEVLESVQVMSSHYVTAQVLAQRARLRGRPPAKLSAADLTEAGAQIERLGLDTERRTRAYIDVLEVALAFVADQLVTSTAQVLGCKLTERDIRFGLERQYRALAHAETGDDERIALIDRANAVRPWTLK